MSDERRWRDELPADQATRVRPRELDTAARITEVLVYAVAVAGVLAGGLLYRDGQPGFAIVAWVLTFAAGTVLRLAAWGARALAELLVRARQLEEEFVRSRAEGGTAREGPETNQRPPDPYRRWGGWH